MHHYPAIPTQTMETLPGYHVAGERTVYRPSGNVSDGELADLLTESLALTLEHNATETLIDVTPTDGFDSPGPAYRRWLVRRWAEMVRDKIRVALIVRED